MGLFCARSFDWHCIAVLIFCTGCRLTKTLPGVLALDSFTVIDFLKDVQRLHGFDQLLLVRNQNATIARTFVCNSEDDDCEGWDQMERTIMDELQVPLLLLNEEAGFYLKQTFSDKFLVVAYIDGALEQNKGLLDNLYLNLRHMTSTNIVFLLESGAGAEETLVALFKLCWKRKMINVVALDSDFQVTATFHSYSPFPEFELEVKPIHPDVVHRPPIFPYRMGNLRGYKLPIILGGSDPRIIVYKKANGDYVVGGFAGHFLRAFANKYNAEIVTPLNQATAMGNFAPSQELKKAVRNGSVDISAGLTFPNIPFSGYTYPYEQLDWCLMMPVEAEVPNYEFFVIVFDPITFLVSILTVVALSVLLSAALHLVGYKPDLLDIVLHDDCLRGVLGQSFSEIPNPSLIVRFIYLQICVLGILLTTSYNSYFATYVTSPPTVAPYHSFDDILHSGNKIFVWTPEYTELLGRNAAFKKYAPMFYKEPNYRNYLKVRDSFNPKYGYMTPTTKWVIFNEQQKVFTAPIFRRRDDLCFYRNIPMCFPIHENSIYKDTLNQHILETDQSGLTNFWRQNGFIELIMAGKLSFVDLGKKNEYSAMQAEDLKYIWIGMGIMAVVVTIVFLLENYVYRRRDIRSKIRGVFRRRFGLKQLRQAETY